MIRIISRINRKLQMKTHSIVFGLCLALTMAWGSIGRADNLPPTYVIDNFANASSVDSWWQWLPNVPLTLSYDAAIDAGGGGTGSGSMKVSMDFSVNSPQFILGRTLSGNPWDMAGVSVPSTAYAYMSYDIRWDPGSTLDGDGTFGSMYVRAIDPSYQYPYPETSVTTPAGVTDWVHVLVPISPADATLAVGGLWLRMWEGSFSSSDSINGPVTFWLDNVELTNVPEPAAFGLLVGGGFLLAAWRRLRSCE